MGCCGPWRVMRFGIPVRTPAGHTQLTSMPYGRRYSASDSVRVTTAALVATYAVRSKE